MASVLLQAWVKQTIMNNLNSYIRICETYIEAVINDHKTELVL